MHGSRPWTKAPRARKSSAPVLRRFKPFIVSLLHHDPKRGEVSAKKLTAGESIRETPNRRKVLALIVASRFEVRVQTAISSPRSGGVMLRITRNGLIQTMRWPSRPKSCGSAARRLSARLTGSPRTPSFTSCGTRQPRFDGQARRCLAAPNDSAIWSNAGKWDIQRAAWNTPAPARLTDNLSHWLGLKAKVG